jgi:hypothetical protein
MSMIVKIGNHEFDYKKIEPLINIEKKYNEKTELSDEDEKDIEYALIGCDNDITCAEQKLKSMIVKEKWDLERIAFEVGRTVQEIKESKWLDLGNAPVSSISALIELKNLELLRLDNSISDISVLKELKNLKTLIIGTNVSDFSVLKELKNLEMFAVLGAPKEFDISILKESKNLRTLDLTAPKMSNISVLKEFKNLQSLVLRGPGTADISVLKELKNLKSLGLVDDKISDSQIEVLKKALPNCEIHTF